MNILKENSTIIIVFIYIFILFKYVKEDDYVTMGILTSIAALIAYHLKGNVVEGLCSAPDDQVQTSANAIMDRNSCVGSCSDPMYSSISDCTGAEKEWTPYTWTEDVYTTAATVASNEPSEEYIKLRDESISSTEGSSEEDVLTGGIGNAVSDGQDTELIQGKPTTTDENFQEGNEVEIKSSDKNLFRIGPYDGLCISKGPEKNYELAKEEEIRTFFGVQAPMNMEIGQPNNDVLSGPTVDGDDESPQRLSMLSNNKASFDCCTNSPFTTNTGCVCLTEKQRHFITTRGFNKSQPDI